MTRKAGLFVSGIAGGIAGGMIGALWAGIALAGGATTLGDRPVLGGGEFTTGGGLTVAVEARSIAGQPHLCGVWAQSRHLSAYVDDRVRDVLEKGVVLSGGKRVFRDFRVFPEVAAAQSYAGAGARCVPVAGLGPDMAVHFPNHIVVNDPGRRSSIQVRFKPTGLSNPAQNSKTLIQILFFDQTEEVKG